MISEWFIHNRKWLPEKKEIIFQVCLFLQNFLQKKRAVHANDVIFFKSILSERTEQSAIKSTGQRTVACGGVCAWICVSANREINQPNELQRNGFYYIICCVTHKWRVNKSITIQCEIVRQENEQLIEFQFFNNSKSIQKQRKKRDKLIISLSCNKFAVRNTHKAYREKFDKKRFSRLFKYSLAIKFYYSLND